MMNKILFVSLHDEISNLQKSNPDVEYLTEDFYEWIDISKATIEESHVNNKAFQLYKALLEKELTRNSYLILDQSISKYFDTNELVFELATFIRLTDELYWNIPIFYFSNKSQASHLNRIKYDSTGISKTEGFHFISKKHLEIDSIINENKLTSGVFSSEKNLETFLEAIQVKDGETSRHSVANEWAMYQWAETLKIEDDESLIKIFNNIQHNLYFKYLLTIQPKEINHPLKLTLKNNNESRVLLIDDDSNKGWFEIFANLLYDKNNIYFDDVDFDFKNKSYEELEKYIIEIIKNSNSENEKNNQRNVFYNIIILDFRLQTTDFSEPIIENISSIKLLKAIKAYNPGIQVIFFSATDKVWNLQKMLELEADGFISKNLLSQSNTEYSVSNSFNEFIKTIQKALDRNFLIEYFEICGFIIKYLSHLDFIDNDDLNLFVDNLKSKIKIIETTIKNIDLKVSGSLDIVFLQCFNYLDEFNSQYIKYDKKEWRYVIGIREDVVKRYENRYPSKDNGEFIPNGKFDEPSWFQSTLNIFCNYFNVCSIRSDEIKQIWNVKNLRHSYIHPNNAKKPKYKFEIEEVLKILKLCKKITENIIE